MAKYNWKFANVGGVTRVRIQSGEDIRHLGELDKKMWTVLSCPTTGLEICEDSLKAMDLDGDGKLRLKEVVAASEWLCAALKDPKTLLAQKDVLAIEDIADEAIAAVAKKIVGKKKEIALADIDAAIAAITVEEQSVPAAPLEADIIAAYKEKSAEYAAYYEQEKLQKLGLALIPEDAPKPGMKEKDFLAMGKQIADWEAAKAAAEGANAAAWDAAKAEFAPLRKLILLHRDFFRVLRNFITFEDFYDNNKKTIASFEAGTLIIDQRACHLCLRVNDLPKHDAQAPQSGIYLLYCDCESKKLGKKMQIVAAMTQGDINNLSVGKNAIFYDNEGNDYDAVVTKIIDNPISIRQAFWTPYRKFAKWIEEKINKSAAEKDAKAFDDMTAKADAAADPNAEKKPAFDIAKFAGIFAAIGMALGMIGTALAAVAKGMSGFSWWQLLIVFVCILLVISGPSMIMAWLKLRRRNLAPVLNANGWAVNADAIISVLFGRTLTEQVVFPLVKDPLAAKKNKMKPWQATCVTIACVAILGLGGWGVYKYMTRPATIEQIEEVSDPQAAAEAAEAIVETPAEEAAE
ncbi:MAG: phage holin family protein [Paludibacteraceae bacterium]|nr:phage holin family protein [Paludibacteraceae bacterium]